MRVVSLSLLFLLAGACAHPLTADEAHDALRSKIDVIEELHRQEPAVQATVSTPFAHRFVAAVAALGHVTPRTVYKTGDGKRAFTAGQAVMLAPEQRAALQPIPVNDEYYYYTRYGSPFTYARALDLLAGRQLVPERGKVLDFGYGGIGQLRALASLGFEATGLDVDPVLPAVYSQPTDQGRVPGFAGAPDGTVRVLSGRLAADARVTAAVGTGLGLIIAKNVLKKGFVKPDRPLVAGAHPMDKGVDDATFLGAFHDALRPGGAFLIYNICPALTPPGQPLVPYSDGRSPFTKEQWSAAGFQVLAFDQDDTAALQRLGQALDWEQDRSWHFAGDVSVLYTLVVRPH